MITFIHPLFDSCEFEEITLKTRVQLILVRILSEELGLKYLALIRGINVGGKNILPKKLLKQAFLDLGYSNVLTYIQSGNILFRSKETDLNRHVKNIEAIFSSRFSIQTRAVVYSETQYKTLVSNAPVKWGNDENFRHRIVFLMGDVTPEKIMKHLENPIEEVESISSGSGVIYSSVSKDSLSKSVLRKFPLTQGYRQVTVRNHNTVYRLFTLFEDI